MFSDLTAKNAEVNAKDAKKIMEYLINLQNPNTFVIPASFRPESRKLKSIAHGKS